MKHTSLITRSLLAYAVIAAICVRVSYADDMDNLFEYDQTTEVAYQEERTGLGAGALVGALAGGPPGLIIGAVGGAIIGRSAGMQQDLEDTKLALAESRKQIAKQKEMDNSTQAALEKKSGRNSNPLMLASTGTLPAAMVTNIEQELANAIEKSILLNIQFRTNSDQLESHFTRQLQQLSSSLLMLPSLDIHLHGYADPRGTSQYNLQLSSKRIQTIRQVLIEAGIKADRIQTHAYGEQYPISTQHDSESYDFERRVLISFENKGGV